MKRSQADQTTAKNLEERFDRGEDVLNYFDACKARIIKPQSKELVRKAKFAYPVNSKSDRRAVVREKSARYGRKNSPDTDVQGESSRAPPPRIQRS